MDTQGNIFEHSKIKLELYRLYLERYLSVLLVTPFFSSIQINDVFAGCGIAHNEEKGSALIAAEVIAGITREGNKFGKPVTLRLNDADQKSSAALAGLLKNYNFASVTCADANQYLQAWNPTQGSHNLFFIDPHGYTQVSIDNLKRMFSMEGCDFLIFIPIYHIYRFLRKEDDTEQLKPIANFLHDLEIGETEAKKARTLEDFAELVLDALQNMAGTEWLYKEMIRNRQYNSTHCLIFITRNILGAAKFLEAQYKLKEQSKANQAQITFDFLEDIDTRSVLAFVERDRPYDNTQLYEIGIKAALLPKQLNKELKKLEETGMVTVTAFGGKERKRKGFYIDYDRHKTKDKMVSIIFKKG